MWELLFKKDMFKLIVAQGITLMLLAGLLTVFGQFPWANAKDISSMEKKHKENNTELGLKYDQMVVLKNQDNKWYRELEIKVATMQNDISYIKGDIKEIKQAVLRGQ